jgi:hypothetical protein
MLKVPSSVGAEILLKVRCPPHTPEKFYQFFTIELLQDNRNQSSFTCFRA